MMGREEIMVHGDLKENSTVMLFEYQPDFSPLSDKWQLSWLSTAATTSKRPANSERGYNMLFIKLGEDDIVILQWLDNTACLMMAATRDTY